MQADFLLLLSTAFNSMALMLCTVKAISLNCDLKLDAISTIETDTTVSCANFY